jgi:hypothetical protein
MWKLGLSRILGIGSLQCDTNTVWAMVIKVPNHHLTQEWSKIEKEGSILGSSSKELHCTENPGHVFPEKKLCSLIPNFYIHISVNDLHMYSHDRSTYFPADRSWEYINRSQIYECRNFYWDRAVSFRGIFFPMFGSLFAVYIGIDMAHGVDKKSIPASKIKVSWTRGNSVPQLVPTRFQTRFLFGF